MALVGINQARPKDREPSTLEKINQGLQIATGILGIPLKVIEAKQAGDRNKLMAEQSKLEQQKTRAEIGSLEDDNTVLTPEEIKPYKDLGIIDVAIPKTRGEARKLASKLVETPEQKASRVRGEVMLNNSIDSLELQKQSNKRQNDQFAYNIGKDQDEKARKEQERTNELTVPGLGEAYTAEDAKNLKEAFASKKSFDNLINEMVALREKNKGLTVFDRAEVEKGEQLSKQALVQFKNMAKLGVLSSSDERLINAVIPTNPLGAGITTPGGADPINAKLKQLLGTTDKDFQTTVGLRVKKFDPNYGKPVQVSPQDLAAIEWVKQNPKDPQATAIKAKLKARGLDVD